MEQSDPAKLAQGFREGVSGEGAFQLKCEQWVGVGGEKKWMSGDEGASRRGFSWRKGPGAESVCHFYMEKNVWLEHDEMKLEETGAGLSRLGGVGILLHLIRMLHVLGHVLGSSIRPPREPSPTPSGFPLSHQLLRSGQARCPRCLFPVPAEGTLTRLST